MPQWLLSAGHRGCEWAALGPGLKKKDPEPQGRAARWARGSAGDPEGERGEHPGARGRLDGFEIWCGTENWTSG